MNDNPTIEVGLKGQEVTNQIFLSPIENFPYIKEKTLFLSLEYYISTAISAFLWSYFTTSAGFKSYSFILKKKLDNSLAYLSKYRDFYDTQWEYITVNKISILLYSIIFIILSKLIKKININIIKYFYIISGLSFCFFFHKIKNILFIICFLYILFY